MTAIVNFISKYPAKFVLFAYVFAINYVVIMLACDNTLKVNYSTILLVLVSNAINIRYNNKWYYFDKSSKNLGIMITR